MAWTYSGDPSAGAKDAVRFLLQDTDAARPLMTDEEIAWVISEADPIWGSSYATAALCADILVAKFASMGTISADGVSISVADLGTRYSALATSLRKTYSRIAGATGGPLALGISVWEIRDFSVKAGSFGMGFMDNFRGGRNDYGERGNDAGLEYYANDGGYWDGG
jgi:hypothetical protein